MSFEPGTAALNRSVSIGRAVVLNLEKTTAFWDSVRRLEEDQSPLITLFPLRSVNDGRINRVAKPVEPTKPGNAAAVNAPDASSSGPVPTSLIPTLSHAMQGIEKFYEDNSIKPGEYRYEAIIKMINHQLPEAEAVNSETHSLEVNKNPDGSYFVYVSDRARRRNGDDGLRFKLPPLFLPRNSQVSIAGSNKPFPRLK